MTHPTNNTDQKPGSENLSRPTSSHDNTNLSFVGKRLPAYGARNKVTGAARYSVDMSAPLMLVGRLLHSPHAHARILSIDKSKAEALPGVKTVMTYDDIPKEKLNPSVQDYNLHDVSKEVNDMYIVSEKARFVGDIIAAVAAINAETAEEALNLIEVEYEVLPAVFNIEDAIKPGAPQVHDFTENNISVKYSFPGSRGDVEAGFRESSVRIEETFKTSKQYIMPLEPLSCLAQYSPNGDLTIWMPVQRPMTFRKKVAELFDLPVSKVNVICEYAGGFFGEANWAILPITVALAKKTNQPVKMEFSRAETALNTASREVYTIIGSLGVKDDGTLTALKEEVFVDSGAFFNRSSATTNVHMATFVSFYRCPNAYSEATAVYSNIPMASGFRGYGGPAAFFVVDTLMDMAAEKLGMDPMEIRLKNVKHMGEIGHAFPLETDTHEKVIRLGAEKIGWHEKKSHPRAENQTRRGVGMSSYFDVSGGQPFERFDRHIEMQLCEDGSIIIIMNLPDGGMNLLGTTAQIAAEMLGVHYENIRHIHHTTEAKMWDMGMGANSGLYTIGNAVAKVALSLKQKIYEEAAYQLGVEVNGLYIKEGVVRVKNKDNLSIPLKDLANNALTKGNDASRLIVVIESYQPTENPNPFGSVFADVAVDTETGEVKIEKLVLVHDIGRAINPTTVEGQLEGGISMGVGYTMYEDPAIHPETGVMMGDNFNTYRIPSTLDMPNLDVLLYEEPSKSGPFGGKGVGMCGVQSITPAVANAIYDAVGVRMTEMPFTPERVLAAIKVSSK